LKYRLTRQARSEVLQIWNYIATGSEEAADDFLDLLKQHFQLLGRTPHAGRAREELHAGYRSFPVGEYLIFYRVGDKVVEIMHVLHGRRNLKSLLE
jgi:toxin ParE1/3/4